MSALVHVGRHVGTDKPGFVGGHHDLGPVPQPQLPQDARHVRLHRPFADDQMGGDFGVRQALGHRAGDVELACRERREVVRCRRRHTGGLASLGISEEGGRRGQALGKIAVVTGHPLELTRLCATMKPVTQAAPNTMAMKAPSPTACPRMATATKSTAALTAAPRGDEWALLEYAATSIAASHANPSAGVVSQPWTAADPNTTMSTAVGADLRRTSGTVIPRLVMASTAREPTTSPTPGTRPGVQISIWLASVKAEAKKTSSTVGRGRGVHLMEETVPPGLSAGSLLRVRSARPLRRAMCAAGTWSDCGGPFTSPGGPS